MGHRLATTTTTVGFMACTTCDHRRQPHPTSINEPWEMQNRQNRQYKSIENSIIARNRTARTRSARTTNAVKYFASSMQLLLVIIVLTIMQ